MFSNLFKFQSTSITASNVVVSLLGVLSMPLLSRLYTAEDFSLLAFFTSSAAVMSAILTLRIEAAIPLAANALDAKRLLVSAFIVTLVASMSAFLIFWFLPIFFAQNGVLTANIRASLLILPFCLLFSGISTSILFYFIWEKQFSTIAKLKSIQALVGLAVQLGIGVFSYSVLGLAIGVIASFIVPALYFSYHGLIKNFKYWQYALNFDSLKIIRNYQSFPIFSAPEKLVSDLSLNLPLIILAVFYDPSLAGLVFVASKCVSLPLNILGNSVASLFTSNCARLIKDGEVQNEVSKIINLMLFLGLLPLSCSLYFSENLFTFIFGEEWSEAGLYLCLLFPGVVYQTIFSPISYIFYAAGENKRFLFLSMLSLVFRALPLILFIGESDVLGLYFFFLGTFLSYFIFLIFALRLCGSTYLNVSIINIKIIMICSTIPLILLLIN